MDEVKETLKEMTRIMRPNLEKLDKSKYPKTDPALLRKSVLIDINEYKQKHNTGK